MERLTERGEDGKYFVRISGDNDLILGAEERLLPGLEIWTGWWEHTVLGNIVDRLAAYEDTGFTPEEVQQMRLIPVEERLPEEKQRVIVRCERVGTSVGWILWGNWMTDIGPGAGKVTHWMPLPKAPKEEKKND